MDPNGFLFFVLRLFVDMIIEHATELVYFEIQRYVSVARDALHNHTNTSQIRIEQAYDINLGAIARMLVARGLLVISILKHVLILLFSIAFALIDFAILVIVLADHRTQGLRIEQRILQTLAVYIFAIVLLTSWAIVFLPIVCLDELLYWYAVTQYLEQLEMRKMQAAQDNMSAEGGTPILQSAPPLTDSNSTLDLGETVEDDET